jgi:hypothetical protein
MPFLENAFNGVLQLCHVVQLGSPTIQAASISSVEIY